jgi:hypothetical protein
MDVIQKMRSAFQKVDPIDMGMNLPSKYGVRKNDYLFVCFK